MSFTPLQRTKYTKTFLGLITAGSYMLYKAYLSVKTIFDLESVTTSKIRSLALGKSKVVGTATTSKKSTLYNHPLFPQDNSLFIFWMLKISNKSLFKRGLLEVQRKMTKFNNFYIKDNTGKLEVDTLSLSLANSPINILKYGFFKRIPLDMKKHLISLGIDPKYIKRGKKIRIELKGIIEGNQYQILGNIVRKEKENSLFLSQDYNLENSANVNILDDYNNKISISSFPKEAILYALLGGLIILIGIAGLIYLYVFDN